MNWKDAGAAKPGVAAPDPRSDDGRNALQGLLAFACIHEQAAKRRRESVTPFADSTTPRYTRDDEFALDEILQLVAARAIAITGADGVAIALAKDKAIVCRASAGRIAPDPGARLDPNSGFSGACLRHGETVRCDDSENDARVSPEICRALGARSMIAVPLSAKQRVIGLVEAFSSEPHGFNESDVKSLNLLGELILAAIRPEEQHHLSAMAREALPDAPAAKPAEATGLSPQPVAASKVLVDEKFAPAPARAPAPQQPAAPVIKAPEKKVVDAKPAISSAAPASAVSAAAEKKKEITLPVAEVAETKGIKAIPLEAPGERPRRRVMSIAVTAASILVAIGLLAGIIWKGQHTSQAISADTSGIAETKTNGEGLHENPVAAPAPPLKIGSNAQVTGIHHSSSADSSTIIVDLEDQVQYEAHSLDNPSRIYFDLHDTKLSVALANQIIEIDDSFLKRVRIAQPVEGVTRVVLETRNQPDFSVSLDTNPYRLRIEVHKEGASPAIKAPAVTLPKPSPSISGSIKKPSAAEGEPFEMVLDAGHGGWDLGTVGRKGLLEKDLVFDIVQRLGSLLENKLGASVIYTRQDDSYVPLEKRAEIANVARADLFLSVHANYSDIPTARGVETYFTNTYSSVKARTDDAPVLQQVNWNGVIDIRAKVMDSKRFASDIQQALYGGLATRNPDIRNRGVKEAQYVVLTGTQMPAVLAEVSFVSSPTDEGKLQSSEYRQLIAEALYKGVVRYRDDLRHTRLASVRKASQ